jgi:hypothetical protein
LESGGSSVVGRGRAGRPAWPQPTSLLPLDHYIFSSHYIRFCVPHTWMILNFRYEYISGMKINTAEMPCCVVCTAARYKRLVFSNFVILTLRQKENCFRCKCWLRVCWMMKGSGKFYKVPFKLNRGRDTWAALQTWGMFKFETFAAVY